MAHKYKLRGNKTHFGYTHEDYSDWGKEGGRPRKFQNEAEKKRFYRQQEKLRATGKPLRKYRSYTEKVIKGTGELSGWKGGEIGKGHQVPIDFINCPRCGVNMAQKGALVVKWNGYGELVDYCGRCGYEPTELKTIYRAGTITERQQRYKKRKKILMNQLY